jgi:transcriptional regulator with XRE-family HTH domain
MNIKPSFRRLKMSIFQKRLKEARKKAKLTQEGLGVLIGIEEATARSRMSHYEHGRYEPDFNTIDRLAKALEVSASYFFEHDDEIARLIIKLHHMSLNSRKKTISQIDEA